MTKWILLAIGILVVGTAIAVVIGQSREAAEARRLAARLSATAPPPSRTAVDFSTFENLPEPVARYFRHVLTDGQPLIVTARIEQVGVLRTSTTAEKWAPFTASHVVMPPAVGFLWNAKMALPLGTHVRILDSYIAGVGAGRVSILSAFAMASEAGAPELNSGALHRYLAEGVWYPTALLPQSGVAWTPIDDHSALATLTDHGTMVSLEFRFNDVGEVTGIYTPGRFGRFDDAYKQVPWEGHFRDYHLQAGMRVPRYGEVGWYVDGQLGLVWKGDVMRAIRFTDADGNQLRPMEQSGPNGT